MLTRLADSIDAFAGSKLRMQRKVLHLSQRELAEALGITVQQIWKYEQGISRISASRLQDIASTLEVPIEFFFSEKNDTFPIPAEVQDRPKDTAVTHFFSNEEGLMLNRFFFQIKNPKVRRAVIDVIKALADENASAETH